MKDRATKSFRHRRLSSLTRTTESLKVDRQALIGGLVHLFSSVKLAFFWRTLVALRQFGDFSICSRKLLWVRRIKPKELLGGEFYPPTEKIQGLPQLEDSEDPRIYYPGIGFRVIADALVTANRRCSYVIAQSELLIPEATAPGPWNIKVGMPITGGVEYQDDQNVMVRLGRPSEVPKGIFVGSWSPHNWYHWTIDTLPSVFLANRLPPEYSEHPLLLPQEALTRKSWLEPLMAVVGSRKIIELPREGYLRVNNLIWIDSPSSPGPLQRRPRMARNFSMHGVAIRDYRNYMLSSFPQNLETRTFRRIFLARKPGSLRPYNQDELLEIAKEYDFEAVYLEEMSFGESIRTMWEADLVVGPHGAGWASALYCRPGTRTLMWSPQGTEWNWFTNIAAVSDFSMLHVHLPTSTQTFDFDPDVFRAELEALVKQTAR